MRLVHLALAVSAVAVPAEAQRQGAPIIDMHLHALTIDFLGDVPACTGAQKPLQPTVDPRKPFDPNVLGKCPNPLPSSASDQALMRESLAMLAKFNIRRAVTAGGLSEVTKWRAAAPDVIIPAQNFATAKKPLSLAELRRLHEIGAFSIFAEVGPQYEGISAGDSRWASFYALAEELDSTCRRPPGRRASRGRALSRL